MRDQLLAMLDARKDEIIAIRRHLHAHPELSFQEEQTAKYIQDFYQGKEVKLDTEVGNGHGLIVTIQGGKPGKTIALRADFDALPIQEETGLPLLLKIPALCTLAAMTGIPLTCSCWRTA